MVINKVRGSYRVLCALSVLWNMYIMVIYLSLGEYKMLLFPHPWFIYFNVLTLFY